MLPVYNYLPSTSYIEPSNLYIAEQTSHLTRAKQLLNQNGSLTEAALLLEAAIQKGELGEGGYEAWILLGETRSMDEREDAGMKALTEGVRRAQEVAQNGEGMLVSLHSCHATMLLLMPIFSHSPSPTLTNLSTVLRTRFFIGGLTPASQRLCQRSSKGLYQDPNGPPTSAPPTRSLPWPDSSTFKVIWSPMFRLGLGSCSIPMASSTRPRTALKAL